LPVPVSILAGAANIWLLALVNRDMHRQAASGLTAIAEFAVALVVMVAVSFISQATLSRTECPDAIPPQGAVGARHHPSCPPKRRKRLVDISLYAALTRDVPSVHDLLIALPNYVFNLTVVIACLIYLIYGVDETFRRYL
jgi:ABC-type siderophore export system fused ATPase/permease subunit